MEHIIELADQGEISRALYSFFKDPFDKEYSPFFSINRNLLLNGEFAALDSLVVEFTLEEIKSALFSFAGSKVLGLDGFSFALFQRFWDLIKDNLLALLQDFHHGRLNL